MHDLGIISIPNNTRHLARHFEFRNDASEFIRHLISHPNGNPSAPLQARRHQCRILIDGKLARRAAAHGHDLVEVQRAAGVVDGPALQRVAREVGAGVEWVGDVEEGVAARRRQDVLLVGRDDDLGGGDARGDRVVAEDA